MDLSQIKSKLDSIVGMNGMGINVYFLLNSSGTYSLKKADIIEDVKANLLDSYKRSMQAISQNDELALINLSSADDRLNAFYKYDLPTSPPMFSYFNDIVNQNLNIPLFSFANDDLTDLEGYFIAIGDHANKVLIYRKQMSVNLFKQGKIYLVRDHASQFTTIKEEFLRIDGKIDIIKIDGDIYVNNVDILARHYEFKTIIENEANTSIASITSLNILSNVAILSARVSDVKFARKLSKISTTSPVFRLPKQQIIAFVQGHSILGTAFSYSTDGTQIVLTTLKSQDFFLRLMNDDFLHSELTSFDYVTPAKDKL